MKLTLQRRIWKIFAGEHHVDNDPCFLRDFLDNNIIAFGNYGEGNIRKYSSIEELTAKLTELRGIDSHQTARYYWKFKEDVEIGDMVIVYGNKTIFAIGYVRSEYFFKKDKLGKKCRSVEGKRRKPGYKLGIPNRRKVKWVITDKIEDEDGELSKLSSPRFTFSELNEESEEIVIKILEEKKMLDLEMIT